MQTSFVKSNATKTIVSQWRRNAWILVLLADVGLLLWGAMAALAPEKLLGPNSGPILPAEYEGFTGYSWSALASTLPMATDFMTLVFRMYGIYGVAFALMAIAVTATAFRQGEKWAWWALLIGNTLTYVSAMTYDWTVRAIGPFELTEYVGLAVTYIALVATAPFKRYGSSH